MLVMTVIFSRVAGLPSEGAAPYAIMVFAAMLPWQFFSMALSSSSHSLVGNAKLISKVYFPRMIIPPFSPDQKRGSEGAETGSSDLAVNTDGLLQRTMPQTGRLAPLRLSL
jgi:hypothetical protein